MPKMRQLADGTYVTEEVFMTLVTRNLNIIFTELNKRLKDKGEDEVKLESIQFNDKEVKK